MCALVTGVQTCALPISMNDISGQQTADIQSITFSQAGSLIHVIQTQLSELRGGTIATADARSLGIRIASNQLVASMSDAPQPGFGNAAGSKVSGERSEEHTSELQSLMRISYAVFCLKKKKTHVSNT